MIAHLDGTILSRHGTFLVLDVHGVGYKLHCTPRILDAAIGGTEASFFTYLAVREDALELFGFPTHEELELFQLLIGISGIGPRSALGIIGLDELEKLVGAIGHGDVGYLTKVSGVGKKSAEKIVLELKEKVGMLNISDTGAIHTADEDVLEALKTLGYRTDEAREALRQIPEDVAEQGARVKEALRILSGR
jgi:Holliday junction DNA helicase RuvA